MSGNQMFLFWLLCAGKFVHGAYTVYEVPAGHLAELPCPSSDGNHRFMFWQLKDEGTIIGPGNDIDESKYNYEVLTGKLFIRGVSTAESGFYKCVSKGVDNASRIKVHVVELIVRKDRIIVPESTYETILIRTLAVIAILAVVVAAIVYVIFVKKRNNRFFEIEESRESSPAQFTGNFQPIASPISPAPPTTVVGIDNAALDIDFSKAFNK